MTVKGEVLASVPCVTCGGEDPKCKSCRGRGIERVSDCYQKDLPRNIGRIMEFIDLAATHGKWPVENGGALNESSSFASAVRAVRNYRSAWNPYA